MLFEFAEGPRKYLCLVNTQLHQGIKDQDFVREG